MWGVLWFACGGPMPGDWLVWGVGVLVRDDFILPVLSLLTFSVCSLYILPFFLLFSAVIGLASE